MVSDLETALAVEAARAGSTEGEATTVLRGGTSAGRGSWGWRAGRGRSPSRVLALAVAAVIAAGMVIISDGGRVGGEVGV